MNDNDKTGLLISAKDIKLQRNFFNEMVKLHGIRVIYRAPKPGKKFTSYAEIDLNYEAPIVVGCLFHEHPTQQSMKKLGWIAELDTAASIIEVSYDLPGLQVGAIFIVPSGIDNTKGRVFRVTKMTNTMVYPSSISCEIVPEYEDVLNQDTIYDTSHSDFNLVPEEITDKPSNKPLGVHSFPIKITEEEDIWS